MSKYSMSKKELIELLNEIQDQAVAESLRDESLKKLYGKLDILLHCSITNEELHNAIETMYNQIYDKLNDIVFDDTITTKDGGIDIPNKNQPHCPIEFIIMDNCTKAIEILESEQDTYKLMKLSPFTEDESENA